MLWFSQGASTAVAPTPLGLPRLEAAPALGEVRSPDTALAKLVSEEVATRCAGWQRRLEERLDTLLELVKKIDSAETWQSVDAQDAAKDAGLPFISGPAVSDDAGAVMMESDDIPHQDSYLSGDLSTTARRAAARSRTANPISGEGMLSYLNLSDANKGFSEPNHSGMVARFVDGMLFERVCAVVIFFNAVFTVHVTNHCARELADKLPQWMVVVEAIFLGWYSLELGLKLYVHTWYFFCHSDGNWHTFDVFIVVMGLAELAIQAVQVDLTFVRVLRILKIGKVMRALKAVRFLRELRLMLGCVLTSLTSLLWAVALMSLFLMIAALIFVQTVTNYRIQYAHEISDSLKLEFVATFGTVHQAMITTFQATTGGVNWGETYAVLCQAGMLNGMLFVLYLIFFVFALSNVVTSIFVDKAMMLAQPDKEWLMLQKQRAEMATAKELRELAVTLDVNRSGYISREELRMLASDTRVRHYFELLDIDVADVDMFYEMMCSLVGSQELDIDLFVAGCMKMKGNASSADVQALLFQTRMLQSQITTLNQGMADMKIAARRRSQVGRAQSCRSKETGLADTGDFSV